MDNNSGSTTDKRLFWACFIALIATAFGFIIRAMIMDQWKVEFGLSETQKGEIFGVGLWPFAISIVLFSLVIDRIGYGKAVVFALFCHLTSVGITICAPMMAEKYGNNGAYWTLYVGNLVVALGNGTVEAFINPIVATMFAREKTKWLNILHAGWPGGLVIGGVLTIVLSTYGVDNWQYKIGLLLIPTLLYGLMMIGCKFPVSERVAAGVSYRDMLKEAGVLSAMVVVALIVREVGRVFGLPDMAQLIIGGVIVLAYAGYVQSLGRILFFILVLIMVPLAITELGTDSWITSLMEPEMKAMNLNPGWVLVYTSFIMMILRFFAGPIVHRLSPLGLLALSAAVAVVGLVALSKTTGMVILVAATIYGFGKTFFWPTMLGVVAEQFPKGGALTLNMISGIGMLGVGVVGGPFFGYIQDQDIKKLEEKDKPLYVKVVGTEQKSVFGVYTPLDPEKIVKLREESAKLEEKETALKEKAKKASGADKEELEAEIKTLEEEQAPLTKDLATIGEVTGAAQKNALMTVAIFPLGMLIAYLLLIGYFKMKGGYQAEVLTGHAAEDEKFTGGVEGPVE